MTGATENPALTVGALRNMIAGIPDDTVVLVGGAPCEGLWRDKGFLVFDSESAFYVFGEDTRCITVLFGDDGKEE